MLDVEELVSDLRAALRESAPQPAVREIVERAMRRPQDELLRALQPATAAELSTLFRSPELTVLKVVWSPGMSIWPHDHGLWAVIGVYGGVEENRFYRRTPAGVELAGDRTVEPGSALLLGTQIVHAVRNPRDVPSATLHVYGGDFFTAPRSEWEGDPPRERPSSGERTRALFREWRERDLARAGASLPGDGGP